MTSKKFLDYDGLIYFYSLLEGKFATISGTGSYLTQNAFNTGNPDLAAIEALSGTSGLLKKTAANTWSLDTNTYLTSFTETDPTVPSWAKESSAPAEKQTVDGANVTAFRIGDRWFAIDMPDSGNDSGTTKNNSPELLKASDISSWAKASTKPTYTLDEVSDGSSRKLSTLAPLSSPALTGTPTAPTAASGTDTTQIATTAFVKNAVDAALLNITQISYSVIASGQDLPASGQSGVIYLKASSNASTGDMYDEYIWLASSNSYELIGHKILDLSEYWNSTNLTKITNLEISNIVYSHYTPTPGLSDTDAIKSLMEAYLRDYFPSDNVTVGNPTYDSQNNRYWGLLSNTLSDGYSDRLSYNPVTGEVVEVAL